MTSRRFGISVIVPLYNRERYITQCLDSILSQDFPGELQVIVVDDGSTDRSLQLVRSYGEKVRLIEKSPDCREQGAAAARNRGLEAAECEFIAFLDSDDYYLDGYIRRMVEALLENPDAGYAFCRCKKEVTKSNQSDQFQSWTRLKLSRLDKKYHVLSRAYCINTNVIVLRSSVLDCVGRFDPALSNGEDSDLWMRVSEAGCGLFLDFYGAVYRTNHGDAQLTEVETASKKKCSDLVYTKAFVRNYSKENPDKLRLLLIIRALLYGASPMPATRLKRIFGHASVLLRMFVILPRETFRFLYLHFF